MQIYTDNAGIQHYISGSLSIDYESGEAVYPVLWDYVVHGGEVDSAKVGGYLNSKLDWSQEAFDANEGLKATVAKAEADAVEAAKLAAIDNSEVGKALSAMNDRFNELLEKHNALVDAVATGDLKAIQEKAVAIEKLEPHDDAEALAKLKEKLAAGEK